MHALLAWQCRYASASRMMLAGRIVGRFGAEVSTEDAAAQNGTRCYDIGMTRLTERFWTFVACSQGAPAARARLKLLCVPGCWTHNYVSDTVTTVHSAHDLSYINHPLNRDTWRHILAHTPFLRHSLTHTALILPTRWPEAIPSAGTNIPTHLGALQQIERHRITSVPLRAGRNSRMVMAACVMLQPAMIQPAAVSSVPLQPRRRCGAPMQRRRHSHTAPSAPEVPLPGLTKEVVGLCNTHQG